MVVVIDVIPNKAELKLPFVIKGWRNTYCVYTGLLWYYAIMRSCFYMQKFFGVSCVLFNENYIRLVFLGNQDSIYHHVIFRAPFKVKLYKLN